MDFNLLKQIVETPGAPGFESPIRSLVETEVQSAADEVTTDGIGNLIAHIQGKGPKVMVSAHLDEISLVSTMVDDQGFIRFHTLGGFDPSTLATQRVMVHGTQDCLGVIGSKPVHVQTDEEKKQPLDVSKFYIDIGYPPEQVQSLVPNGSPITRLRSLQKMGDCVTGKSLDNRISVYLLVETIKQMAISDIDFYGVFTVQEEVGIRGARVAANAIQPDIGINLDVTLANDVPGTEQHQHCTTLGGGTAIKILDKSVISSPEIVEFLTDTAISNNIPYQREVLTAGGTDTSAMQYLMGLGTKVGCISTPTRYVHSTVETVHTDDISAGIRLLNASLSDLHKLV